MRDSELTEIFQTYRQRLWQIAYRIVGSNSDADDVLQDAYIRWSKANVDEIENHLAFMTTIVSRLSIDKLRKRKKEAQNYIGPWLPEPIPTDDCLADDQMMLQSINMAFMVVLEQLKPLERAVFILREAFENTHRDIADTLNISEANARQIYRRTKKLIVAAQLKTSPRTQIEPLVNAFINAAHSGAIQDFTNLLCDDVIAYTDGGGIVSAALVPIQGPEKVIAVFSHLIKKFNADISIKNESSFEWGFTNDQSSIIVYEDGKITSIMTFELKHEKIHRIFIVRNPEKFSAYKTYRPSVYKE